MPPPAIPAPAAAPEGLFQTLLAVSLTGVILFRPVYGEGPARVVDWTYVQLNPAAQRMLQLPECPTQTFLTLFPNAVGTDIMAFYRDTFETGTAGRYQVNYQHDGLDNYYHLAAQRHGELLVVSFTDTANQPRTAVEVALRAAQAAEQAAYAEANRQREQLHGMFAQAPAMICIFDGPEHVFQFVNPPYQALVGPRPLLGLPIAKAMPELAGQPVFDLLDEVYRTGETFRANEMLVQLDHANAHPEALEKRYYNFTYQARHNLAGATDGILVFAYEVTPQVQARQQLQQLNNELETRVAERTREAEAARADAEAQRNRLHLLFAQVPTPISVHTGPAHVFEWVHPHTAALLGHRPLLGLSRREALPELPEAHHAPFDEAYRTGRPVRLPEVLTRVALAAGAEPTDTHYDVTYQPLFDATGRIEGVMSFSVDVTEQMLARHQNEALQAELLAAAQRQVQERETFFKVFEQTPALIQLLRAPNHRIEYVNPAYQRLFPGRPLVGHDLAVALPELREQGFIALIDRVYQTGETYYGTDVPMPLARPAGPPETRYFDFTYQAYLEDGQTAGIAVYANDVTEQVQARQQVEALNQELAATNAELHGTNARLTSTNADLDTFIYTASHDLKAPIANIEGLLAALGEHLPDAARQAPPVPELFRMMQGAVERFQLTIDQLTDITKLQQAQQQSAEAVDLAALIEAVRLDLALVLAAAGAEVAVAVADCPTVHFAPKNLRSIIYNLLSNAVKYRHPHRAPVVQVRSRPGPGRAVVLEVTDNGLGLSESQQAKLFGMFQRLHTHVEGSGIGLYMIKKIVDNAGGTIAVRSQPEHGTTFTVTLPG